MRVLLLIAFASVYLFGGIWSTTSMSIATSAITSLVSSNMATVGKQTNKIKEDYNTNAVANATVKKTLIDKIRNLDGGIMVEMRSITENQEKINLLYKEGDE